MTFAIPAEADTAQGIRHAVEDQLDKTIETLDSDEDIHEKVHDVRKRFKKVRAALRLAREPLGEHYKPDNVHFRDAGRRLSDIRDAHAMLETLERLREVFHDVLNEYAFDDLQRRIELRRDEMAEKMDLPVVLEDMREVVAEGRERMERWEWTEGSFEDLQPGLEKSFDRARDAMHDAYGSDEVEDFHEWRKRTKYHRYHLRILREGWKEVLNPQRDKLHDLTDYLGDDHDMAVFLEQIEADDSLLPTSTTARAIRGLFHSQSEALREASRPLGKLFFGEPTEQMSARIRRMWKFA